MTIQVTDAISVADEPDTRQIGVGAFSSAMAIESIGQLGVYDISSGVHNGVTVDALVQYARTVAYKVFHNLKHGHPMLPQDDPLTVDGIPAATAWAANYATTQAVTDAMVSRFLGWKLPDDFAPDCGVSFDGIQNELRGMPWPTGTNLLTATHARAMLEHVLGVEASGAISSKTAKVDVIFGGEVLARGVSPADPGQGPIDLGEVTGTKPASCAYGKCVQDVGQCAGVCLAAAAEREACAMVCEAKDTGRRLTTDYKVLECAAAIRARGAA